METELEPPELIPSYIVDGIDRQGTETLAAIESYARDRRKYLSAKEAAELKGDELADTDEELVEAEDTDGGTVVIKKVPCGKQCDGCPHGPYKYVVTRDGESLNWEYKGAVEE